LRPRIRISADILEHHETAGTNVTPPTEPVNTPLVDVGIPTFGEPRYLAEAVESVLSQTLPSLALTVAENGPASDSVKAALEPYLGDPRVAYVARGENLGAARNSSLLVLAGTAPYVALLHDDDRWEPAFLARRVALLDAHPECGWAFGSNIEIDSSGREIRRWAPDFTSGVLTPEVFVAKEARDNVIAPSATLVRRSAYEAVGSAFDGRFVLWDWEMWIRLGLRFPTGYLDAFDSAYRVHPAQTTARLRDIGEDMLRLHAHIEGLIEQELPGARLSERQRRRKRSAAALSAALDAVERSERRTALAHVARAIGAYPPSLADPRTLATMLTLPAPRHGPVAVAGMRRFAHKRRLRMHLLRPW
jgi:glycosyltransferase involved in cell wall biosynthesis